MTTAPVTLVGVAEIADRLNVRRTTVSNWISRSETTNFPAPLEKLRSGPVFDWERVKAWHEACRPIKR